MASSVNELARMAFEGLQNCPVDRKGIANDGMAK